MALTSIPTILLGSLLIVILSTLVPNNVNAYKTYDLTRYCERSTETGKDFRRSREESAKSASRIEVKQGLIIPDRDDDDDHSDDGYDEDELNVDRAKASKSVLVETTYDESMIRVVAGSKGRMRNWQHCAIFIAARKPHGLILTIRKLRLRPGVDWLRLSINNGTFVREFSHVTINDERDSVAYVAQHGVLIELESGYSSKSTERNEIELTLTAFREADLCDIDHEFDCGSFRCISNYYLCDGVNNCGDARDETGCPMDNITNYLIISTTLLLVAFLIFLCLCYRCCCQKRRVGARKQYQYVKIRAASLATSSPGASFKQRRSTSIHSESDVLPPRNDSLRRVKFAHVGDSMPVLVAGSSQHPTAPIPDSSDYGATGQTYVHLPYQPYAIQLGPSSSRATPTIGIIPFRHHRGSLSEHHTFPLRQQTYPSMPAQLFTPPPPPPLHNATPPPPPYTPREEAPLPPPSVPEEAQHPK